MPLKHWEEEVCSLADKGWCPGTGKLAYRQKLPYFEEPGIVCPNCDHIIILVSDERELSLSELPVEVPRHYYGIGGYG